MQLTPLVIALSLTSTLIIGTGITAQASDMDTKHAGHAAHQAAMTGDANPHAEHQAMIAQPNRTTRSQHAYQTPDLVMQNNHGTAVHIQQLLNQPGPVMVNFIFTSCPTICPVLSATFAQVNQSLGKDSGLTLISISIDPEQDTPTALQQYADKFSADDNWTFITGQIEQSIAVQKAFDIYRGSKMNHVPATFFRASAEQPWTRLDGFASSEQLIAEYHQMVH